MLRLEDNLDILQKSIMELPRDPDDSSLVDIRGSLLLYYKTSSWAVFGSLFGRTISIQNLIDDDCRFRLHQKHRLAPLNLKFYHPKWKMVFKFKVVDTIGAKKFWNMHIQQVLSELCTRQYFQGCYVNTIFRQPDMVVLETSRFKELKQNADKWTLHLQSPKPTMDRVTPVGMYDLTALPDSKMVLDKKLYEDVKKKADRYDQHMYDVELSPSENRDYTMLKEASINVLLEEIERRYKEQNPEWAEYLLREKQLNTAEIIELINAA